MASAMNDSDAGSDTLARFRYQAEVTLPYCVSALLRENDIQAVVAEHREDIALKTSAGWRFLQVKSRNPERGLWTAADLFRKRGGALRSLYRTYLLTEGEDHSLELVLEGAVRTDNAIRTLRSGQDRSELVQMAVDKLGTTEATAKDFVRRVTLNESASHQKDIHATNARLLHQHAPSLTLPQLEALHDALLGEIEKAMRCERPSPLWPRSVAHPSKRPGTTEERLSAKTLDAVRLPALAEQLASSARPLLKRIVEPGAGPVSALMQKLVMGGAPTDLIQEARNLQANALHHRLSRMAQKAAWDDALVTDLHQRLRAYAITAAAVHASSPQPAIGIWNYLLDKFDARAAEIDRHSLVSADPMLLMGESCILSDECTFGWGES